MSRNFRFSVPVVICLQLPHTLLFQQPQSFANKVLVECYNCNYTMDSYKSLLCKSSVIISSYTARSTRHTGTKAVCQFCVRKEFGCSVNYYTLCRKLLFPICSPSKFHVLFFIVRFLLRQSGGILQEIVWPLCAWGLALRVGEVINYQKAEIAFIFGFGISDLTKIIMPFHRLIK